MITDAQRAEHKAAAEALRAIETERAELVAHTDDRHMAALARFEAIEEIAGEPVATCEACGKAVFAGEPVLFGADTDLCGDCAPKYADLVDDNEVSGFVDNEGEPLSPVRRREIYDEHLAAGGRPTDSMATIHE